MSGRQHPGIPICLAVLALLLSGCAGMKSSPKPVAAEASSPQVESPPPTQAQQPSKPPAQTPAVHKSTTHPPSEPALPPSPKQCIEAGEYQKALEEYGVKYRKHPGDQALTKAYAKSVEEVRSAADKAMRRQRIRNGRPDLRPAAQALCSVQELRPHAHLQQSLSREKLSLCKKSLSVMGFQEYRKGNLNEAITMWPVFLMIDPHNEDIRKAMNTATEQQKNLQTKK